ncbi:MAG: hypothetical protein IJ309_01545 [Clostridia bacterium]|nr:hypothetical protein [Clostridia bacterium]
MKRILAIFATLCLLFCLVGCNESPMDTVIKSLESSGFECVEYTEKQISDMEQQIVTLGYDTQEGISRVSHAIKHQNEKMYWVYVYEMENPNDINILIEKHVLPGGSKYKAGGNILAFGNADEIKDLPL